MTTNTTNITNTVDRLIAGIARRNVSVLEAANRAALMIVGNPSDLAGRSITLLEAMSGVRAQRNLVEFFDVFLPNEISEKKNGGYVLGKKRADWVEPQLPETGLIPTSYINTEKVAATKAARAEKVAATKAAKLADAEKAAENHNKRESDLLARERAFDSRIESATAAAQAAINKATAETFEVKAELKAENDRLQMAISQKNHLEKELAIAQRRIQELETELAAMKKALTATATADTDTDTDTATVAPKPTRRKKAA